MSFLSPYLPEWLKAFHSGDFSIVVIILTNIILGEKERAKYCHKINATYSAWLISASGEKKKEQKNVQKVKQSWDIFDNETSYAQ